MPANKPEQAEIIKTFLKDNPQLGNTEAAKKLKELHTDIFKKPIETIRSNVRYYRGKHGQRARNELADHSLVKQKENHDSNLKILLFDIETSHSEYKATGWSKWDTRVIEVTRPWFIYCWSAKYLFEDKMYSSCITSKEIRNADDDSRVVKNLWYMLDDADVVIAHNGDKFDMKKANVRFIKHGLPPITPVRQIDTLKIAKAAFKFDSNRLDDLGEFLEVGRKVKTPAGLWQDCWDGNADALKSMQHYCDGDIKLLEDVYLKLRPYAKNHPNIGLLVSPSEVNCKHCGHHELTDTGKYYYTNTYAYEVLRCNNCGRPNHRPNAARPKGHNLLK